MFLESSENIWMWLGFFALIAFVLLLDLGVLNRKAHRVSTREALIWTTIWITLALLFAVGLYFYNYNFLLDAKGAVMAQDFALTKSTEFLTGYVIEESLSVDNLFVFVLVFRFFKVEDKYQHRVLFWGVLGAIIMRAIFIFAGVALIEKFHWIIYVFGAFLVYTGLKLFLQNEADDADFAENVGVKLVKKFFSVTSSYDGQKFFTIENGKRVATPLFLVLVVVEITDLIFAVDSIPAVLAVSSDPFIVFTSNIFAIMGLRSLYFLLADIVERFVYLKTGLAVILTFVGVKMLASEWYKVPAWVSLCVIIGVLVIAVVASLYFPPKEKTVHDANP
jgi:tellurite resistance protein TerC